MKQQARNYFPGFTDQFEGTVFTMYRDSEGWVTTGRGNLIDPVATGWSLPWKRQDGSRASQSEYIMEWGLIKNTPGLDVDGWKAAARLCKLHLDKADVDAMVNARLDSNEVILKRRLPSYDSWCADAQLFIHSMAWACGANMNYPRMFRQLNDGKFLDAIAQCGINSKRGSIILRNAANRQLLTNAFYVHAGNMDREQLVYPGTTVLGDEAFDHTVMGIQHTLALLGFTIIQDGVMGPKTQAAIRKFQGIHKLTVDGIVGPVTQEALLTALRFR